MRHLIESASKLTEATPQQLNQMRQYIQTLTQALEMYPDMASDIEPRLQRLRAFVQGSQNQQPGNPNDPRGDQTAPLAGQGQPDAQPDIGPVGAGPTLGTAAANASANANQAAADAAMGDRGPQATGPNVPQNLRFATRQAAQRALGPNVARAINSNGRPINGTTTIMIGNEYFAVPRATGTAPGQPAQAAAAQPQTVSEGKAMKKTINEASVNINGTAEEIAELMRMMQLSGAPGAKPVDATDINPGPKPCPICGKIHGPMPKPGGCGMPEPEGPPEPDMGDMIRMISKEENEDGGFEDATTEPDEYTGANAGDVSDVIPDGNDLHKEKDSYPATAGGDNPMRIKEALWKALNEKKKKAKPDYLDFDGDGDKKEPMKKALKDKKKK